jgi:SAM-dependent methyltransferase
MKRLVLYKELAPLYDSVYHWKDYEKEVGFLIRAFHKYRIPGKNILEVAVGTGNHAVLLAKKGYQITGVDLNRNMLRIAKQKIPNGRFTEGDMRKLDGVDGQYDAVLCMFSAITYNTTLTDLRKTIEGMCDRTADGGIAIFDEHFLKETIIDGHLNRTDFGSKEQGILGSRFGYTKLVQNGRIARIRFNYMWQQGSEIKVVRDDVHDVGVFSFNQFVNAMKDAGFGQTDIYDGFTFRKVKRANSKVRDYVFVGKK